MKRKKTKTNILIIFVVFALTIYNILPTIFYYAKPLKSPIEEKQGLQIAKNSLKRVNSLEKDSLDWLHSFCKLLQITPQSIELQKENPEFIHLSFSSKKDTDTLSQFLPRAGALIPFSPAQLSLASDFNTEEK